MMPGVPKSRKESHPERASVKRTPVYEPLLKAYSQTSPPTRFWIPELMQQPSSLMLGFLGSLGHGIGGTAGETTPALATYISGFKIGKVGNILEELTITGMAVKVIGKKCLIDALINAG